MVVASENPITPNAAESQSTVSSALPRLPRALVTVSGCISKVLILDLPRAVDADGSRHGDRLQV
jgi:hypothetical protein